MGQVNAQIRQLQTQVKIILGELESLKRSGATKEELVSRAIEIPKEVTEEISSEIRNAYDDINTAIQKLDRKSVDYGDKKHKLQELKKDVPIVFALPKDIQRDIIEEINKILGVNRSDTNY